MPFLLARSKTLCLIATMLLYHSSMLYAYANSNPFENRNQYSNFKNIFLPQNANLVNAVYQDEYGMMWVGTEFGLFFYDGYKVQSFAAEFPKSIFSIIGYEKDKLCLATDEGVLFFNLKTERFEFPTSRLKALKSVRSVILFDRRLWIGTREKGLWVYDASKDNLSSVPCKDYGTEKSIIYTFAAAGNILYIGAYDGLSKYDINTHQRTRIQIEQKRQMVNSLYWQAEKSTLWIGTEGSLFQYHPALNTLTSVAILPQNSFKSITADGDSNIVLGTDNGLYIYYPDKNIYQKSVHDSRNPASLCNNVLWAVYRDKANNVWCATDYGLAVTNANVSFQFLHLSELVGTGDGNQFSTMTIDDKGNYWFGGVNGLVRLKSDDEKHWQVQWFRMENPNYPLRHNRIRDIYLDRDNMLWIATDGGIAHFDYASDCFIYHPIANKESTLNANWAYSLYQASDNTLWIATYLGGLFVVDKQKLLAHRIATPYIAERILTKENGLNNIVSQIMADPKGNIWANTPDGLAIINPHNNQITKLNIYADRWVYNGGNYIWYTQQNTIYRLNIETKCSEKIRKQNDVNKITAISLTDKKFSYAAIGGIYSIDLHSLELNKLPLNDYNLQSVCYNPKKQIFIWGGKDGILSIFPPIQKKNTSIENYPASIVSVYSSTHRLEADGIDYEGSTVRYCQQIRIPNRWAKNLSIEFSPFTYNAEIEGDYYYRILPLDTVWHKIEAGENKIVIGQLSVGKYHLHIRRYDHKESDIRFGIEILPPWYTSTWAKIFYLLLSLFFVYCIYHRLKIKYQQKLARIEKEKTLELATLKMDFFVNIAHELKTPLTLVISPLTKLLGEIRNKDQSLTLEQILGNARRLNTLIQKILDFKTMEYQSDDSAVRSHVEMKSFVENLTQSFIPILSKKQIDISFHSDVHTIWMNVDVLKMESVLTNIISNAQKFMRPTGGKINITLSADQEKTTILVQDTGQGILSKDLPNVFIRFFQSSDKQSRYGGQGIGLYLAQKYIHLHSGNISIYSEGVNKGTTVKLILPLSGDNLIASKAIVEHSTSLSQNEIDLPTLLIVDDNQEFLSFLQAALSKHYSCLVATNGTDGLMTAQKHLPDLIIIDQMMPEMDGAKMCRALRKYQPTATIPIIMLTAKSDIKTQIESLKAGVNIFISKPFDINVLLLHLVQQLQARKNLQAQIEMNSISKNTPIETTLSSDAQLLTRIVNLIEDNMADFDFNVSMLSNLINIEQKALYRKIKQLTGKTPVEYIRSIRMKKAAMLLSQHNFTVAEVMYMVGFSNHSYFSKCFQNEFGVTPNKFRG